MPVDKFGSGEVHRPRVWPTRNCFAYLGDIRGFDAPGNPGLYALESTAGGLYRRSPIETKASEEPEWEVKLDLQMSFMDLQSPSEGAIPKLMWLINSGSMLVVYGKSGTEPMVVSGRVNDYYLAPKGNGVAKLKAATTFPKDLDLLKHLPKGYTAYLELGLGAMTPSEPVEVVPGISLKWKRPETVGLVIKNIEGEISLSISVPDLESKVEPDKFL